MNIGSVIKKLRRERDITQEKFAEYLNISAQAVSRWENGAAYPDITMIPAIARFFEVSTDLLLGVDAENREAEIQAILDEYNRLDASGEQKKRFDLMKKAKDDYPGEFRILEKYAWELIASPYELFGKTEMTPNEIRAVNEEVIAICKRILEDCTIDEVRYSTLNLASMAYMELDDMENAELYAKKLPNWWNSSDMTLYRIWDSDSDEHTKFRQGNIADLANLLWLWIRTEVWMKKNPADKITLCRKALTVYETLYENGDYGYAHEMVGQIYGHICDACLAMGDTDGALDAVEQLAAHKAVMDTIADGTPHTSMLFESRTFTTENLSKSYTCSNAEIALMWLEDKKYDSIRETERFAALVQSLRDKM